MQPVLSVLVISFNQRELLRRCFQSLLEQRIRVPWEIILSDALSHDGTYELAEEYAANYNPLAASPNAQGYYSPQFVPVHCDTDVGGAQNRTECCGWMKLTAYRHARGEYFVNIDAEDYLRSNDIYQLQLDTLTAHPECSMCMQDVWQVNDGEPLDKGFRWPSYGKLTHQQILSPAEIISEYRALNQCYLIRRHPEVDCAALYGKHFDDTVITLHHLQFGPVVYVDRADYVWVKYNTSIGHSIVGDDRVVEYGLLPLHHIRFIPTFATEFIQYGLQDIIHMLKHLSQKRYRWQLSESTQVALREAPGRIYRVFSHNQPTLHDRMYLRYVRLVALLYSRLRLTNWHYLYGLLISRKAAKEINWNDK